MEQVVISLTVPIISPLCKTAWWFISPLLVELILRKTAAALARNGDRGRFFISTSPQKIYLRPAKLPTLLYAVNFQQHHENRKVVGSMLIEPLSQKNSPVTILSQSPVSVVKRISNKGDLSCVNTVDNYFDSHGTIYAAVIL
jgi:hypothetical protein